MKYEQFNLDLSRMLIKGMIRRGHDIASLAEALTFSVDLVMRILERPIAVPSCDFAAAVELLGLEFEYHETYLREIKRTVLRDPERPTLH